MIKINGFEIKPTIFPDKTSQVWKIPTDVFEASFAKIEWDFESEAEIIHLAQLKDLTDSHELESLLIISYLPYARQDKFIANDATFALSSFAKLLNTMNFDRIVIQDPHSHRATDLIKCSAGRSPDIYPALRACMADILCYPDKGAKEKYSRVFPEDFIYGEKVRDQLTGQIMDYSLFGDAKDKKVLIVDDICDGGATFIFLADALINAGAKEVNLFVSHGLFTKGIKILKSAGIVRIFTKNGEVHDTSN